MSDARILQNCYAVTFQGEYQWARIPLRLGLSVVVSREAVEWAYLMILGRAPESDEVIAEHCLCTNLDHLRETLITSDEGYKRLRHDMQHVGSHLPFRYNQPGYAFIHIEKTGGTSFYGAAVSAFDSSRVSLPHVSDISSYSISELNQYDSISGHMTYGEATSLPWAKIFLVAMFRDPITRIISYYRFQNAHPLMRRDRAHVRLAQDLSIEAFCVESEILSDPKLDNRYLRILADIPDDEASSAAHLPLALARLESLDAIGITERFSDSLALFSHLTGKSCEPLPRRLNATDDLYLSDNGYRLVDRIVMTETLRRVIAPLVRYDRVIYRHAVERMEAMVADLRQGQVEA